MIAEPQKEDGFTAFVTFVDDRAYEGIRPPQLLAAVPAGVHHAVAFLVDRKALTHPDRPILVVNLYDYVEDLEDHGKGPQYGATFRVVPSEMWSVQKQPHDLEHGLGRVRRQRGQRRHLPRLRVTRVLVRTSAANNARTADGQLMIIRAAGSAWAHPACR